MVALNSRRFLDNKYFLFVGIAYLFIAGLDLIHTLAYAGMGVFEGYDTNLPTQLWIVARYIESLTLLIAPLLVGRKLRIKFVFSSFTIVISLLLLSIFYWNIFPNCFVEGVGLTLFKKISEYIISLMLIGSIFLLLQKREKFDTSVLQLLIASIIVTIAAELAFTFYVSAYGFSNLIGHFLKIISFYLIYKAIIETGLIKPYNVIFRELKQREEAFHKSEENLAKAQAIANLGSWEWDVPANEIHWSDEMYRIYGFGRDVEPSIDIVREVIYPDDREVFEKAMVDALGGRGPEFIEYRIVRADGEVRFVQTKAEMFYDESGKLTRMIGTVQDITERKQAEEKIKEERNQAQKYLDVAGAIFVAIDTEGKVTLINKKGCEVLGYDESDITGKNWFDSFLPKRLIPEVKPVSEKLLAGELETAEYYENPILTKQGKERLISWHNTILENETGEIVGHLSSGEDITERKRAEDLLRAQRNLGIALSATAELEEVSRLCVEAVLNMPELDYGGIYLVDETTGGVNLAFAKGSNPDVAKNLLHFDADSPRARLIMNGKPIYTQLQELGVPIPESLSLEGLRAVAVIPVHHEGRVIASLNAASRTLDEMPASVRNTLETIAAQIGSAIARVQVEEVLRESEEKYRTLSQNIPGMSYRGRPDWSAEVFSNSKLICGYDIEDFNSHSLSWLDITHPDDREKVFKEGSELVRRKVTLVQEYRIIARDGSVRWVADHKSSFFLENGEFGGVDGIVYDITARKQAEEQLKAAFTEKEVLLREVYHRVKNNLQVLIYLIDMQSETLNDPKVLQPFKEFQSRIRAMALVHEELYQAKDLAQIDFGVYLQNLTTYLFHALADGQAIALRVDADNVFIDVNIAIPLGMIVNELVTNALKYAFPEDRDRGGEDEISIKFELQEDEYVLTVSDNGVGLPAEYDWRTTQSLGMKLVNIWASYQLKGNIEVDTTYGTAFTIRFKQRKRGGQSNGGRTNPNS